MKTDAQVILESELAEVLYMKQLRDQFAIAALNAFLTWSDARDVSEEDHAMAAYDVADAMVKARDAKEAK